MVEIERKGILKEKDLDRLDSVQPKGTWPRGFKGRATMSYEEWPRQQGVQAGEEETQWALMIAFR